MYRYKLNNNVYVVANHPPTNIRQPTSTTTPTDVPNNTSNLMVSSLIARSYGIFNLILINYYYNKTKSKQKQNKIVIKEKAKQNSNKKQKTKKNHSDDSKSKKKIATTKLKSNASPVVAKRKNSDSFMLDHC